MMAFPRAKHKTESLPFPNESSSHQIKPSLNPWDHDNPFIKKSRDALILAEQMNINTLQNESMYANALADLPSFKLIALQKEITEKRNTAGKIKQDIAAHRQYQKSADVLNLDLVEKRINMLKLLCNDLDSVLRNKEKLMTRLQTPFVGDFIKVEAKYHRYVFEVLSDLVSSVVNVSPYLDNMTWMAYRDLAAAVTEPLTVEVQSLMASLQTSYQMVYQMKTGIEELSSRQPEATLHTP